MDDLIAFLRARLNEDEQVARRLGGRLWEASSDSGHAWRFPSPGVYVVDDNQAESRWQQVCAISDQEEQVHIARWDPARVLAEVQAKRRIVDAWQTFEDEMLGLHSAQDFGIQQGLGVALRCLAFCYAGHPDYRPEWAPGEEGNRGQAG